MKTIRIKFGNGSKGNRENANNRGNAFETQFAIKLIDIEKWYAENQKSHILKLKMI